MSAQLPSMKTLLLYKFHATLVFCRCSLPSLCNNLHLIAFTCWSKSHLGNSIYILNERFEAYGTFVVIFFEDFKVIEAIKWSEKLLIPFYILLFSATFNKTPIAFNLTAQKSSAEKKHQR